MRGKIVLADGVAADRPPPRLRGARRRRIPLRLSRTRPRRGPATIATSSGGGTCRPTSRRTASRSWSRSARRQELRDAARRRRDDRPARPRRREDGAGDLRRRRRDDPRDRCRRPARSSSRRISATSPPAPTTTPRAAPRSSRSPARSPRRSGQADPAPPRRTIRFLWLPEITGSQAYLVRHPEVVARLVGGVHMDMVGGLLATTKGTFHVSRTAETLPHVANAIAAAWFDQVVGRASPRYAEGGRATPMPASSGRRARARCSSATSAASNMGSDHEVFEAAGFRVPMVYFHDYPDVTIHTQKDQPENLDATKLGRVAYLGAGVVYTLAALPDAEAPRLLALARADVEERIAPRGPVTGPDAALVTRREAVRSGIETLESVARLWPSTAPRGRGRRSSDCARTLPAPAAAPADRRVPIRNPDIVGPLERLLLRLLRRHPGGGLDEDGARAARRRRRPRLRGAEPRRRHSARSRRSATSSPAATRPSPSPRSRSTSSCSRGPEPSRLR